MADRESRALLIAYRNSVSRYQNLLRTQLTDVERNYIDERLSAYHAAIEALSATKGMHGLGRSSPLCAQTSRGTPLEDRPLRDHRAARPLQSHP
jgi:hypothetical protein